MDQAKAKEQNHGNGEPMSIPVKPPEGDPGEQPESAVQSGPEGVPEDPQQVTLLQEIGRLERIKDRSAKVVVVDDMQTMRLLLVQTLRGVGFENINRASDGESAYRVMTEQGCDLAIVDWSMPRMDGMELLEKVRSDPDICDVVFIMVTAETMDRKVIQAAEEKQDAYLAKPISPGKLTRRLDMILEKRLTVATSMLLEVQGEVERAVELLVNASQNQPSMRWPLFALGRLMARQKNHEEAERCFRQILDDDSDALSAMVELGLVREEQGDIVAGQRLYQKAMTSNPMFFRAYDVLAGSLQQSGDPHEALEVLQKAVGKRGSENADRQELLGQLCYELEQYSQAEAAFEKTLKLKPKRNLIQNNLAVARCRIAQGLVEEALEPLKAAAKGNPYQPDEVGQLDAMLLMGGVHIQCGDLAAAEKAFERIKEPRRWGGEPPFEGSHLHREVGGIYLRSGREDEARDHFAKSLDGDLDDPENLKAMQKICDLAGRHDILAEELQKARERKERLVEHYSRQGLTMVSQGRFEDALHAYQMGLKEDPRAGRLHFNLGKLEYRLELKERARQSMVKSARLGLAQRDWELVAEVARFLDNRGKREQALGLLQKLGEIDPGNQQAAKVLNEFKAADRKKAADQAE